MKIRFTMNLKAFVIIQVFLIMSWLHYLAPSDAIYCSYALCAIAAVFCLYDNYLKGYKESAGEMLIAFLASGVLAVSVALANYSLYLPLTDIKPLFGLCCTLAGGTVVFFNVTLFLMRKLGSAEIGECSGKTHRLFWICFAAVATVDLVYLLLVEYPGIISNDTRSQLYQVFGGEYSNHHPFYHTLVMKLFINLGYFLFRDNNGAFAVYAAWQALFMAAAFAYTVQTLYEAGVPRKLCLFMVCFYALMPYNITHSIYATKDVVFTGALLFFVVSLYRILRNCGSNGVWNYIVFGISGLLSCIWRSNGIIALAVSLPIFAFFLFGNHKKVLLIMLGALCAAWVLTNPVLSLMNVKQPDVLEALSIPIQQVSRVIYDGGELTEAQQTLIGQVIDIDEVPELYQGWLSDPMKDEIRSKGVEHFEDNIAQYGKLWVELGLKYPMEYVKAWIDQTKGYWNGGYDYFIHVSGVVDNTLGIASAGYNHIVAKVFRGLLRVSRGLVFLDPFESIGLHVWLLFLLMIANWKKKQYEGLLCVPALAVILTLMIATPVYSQFRYAYPVFVICPFVLLLSIYKKKKD